MLSLRGPTFKKKTKKKHEYEGWRPSHGGNGGVGKKTQIKHLNTEPFEIGASNDPVFKSPL